MSRVTRSSLRNLVASASEPDVASSSRMISSLSLSDEHQQHLEAEEDPPEYTEPIAISKIPVSQSDEDPALREAAIKMRGDIEGVMINHTPMYLDPEEAETRYKECRAQIPFAEMKWSTGKNLPRLVYRYDCQSVHTPDGQTELPIRVLDALIWKLQIDTGRTISGVFCNYYRDGRDHTPPHQDSYGKDVFTLSLGGTRICRFLPLTPEVTSQEFELNSGDLLYFNLAANEVYKHSIPPKSGAEPRISLVFFAE